LTVTRLPVVASAPVPTLRSEEENGAEPVEGEEGLLSPPHAAVSTAAVRSAGIRSRISSF
jgi:hypothetical protein